MMIVRLSGHPLVRNSLRLHKGVMFQWTDKCQESLQALKDKLTSAPVLAPPDTKKDFVIYCDASLKA